MKIFGREPALIISTIGSVVAFLVSVGLDSATGAAVVAFLSAIIIAVTTRPVAPALFTAVLAPAAALAAQFGLHWNDAQVGAVAGIVLAGFALFGIRPQATPASDPMPTAPASGVVR